VASTRPGRASPPRFDITMCGLLYLSIPFAPLWLELPRCSGAQTPFTRVPFFTKVGGGLIGGVGDALLMCPQARGFLDPSGPESSLCLLCVFWLILLKDRLIANSSNNGPLECYRYGTKGPSHPGTRPKACGRPGASTRLGPEWLFFMPNNTSIFKFLAMARSFG
jgi:hypothetical protein